MLSILFPAWGRRGLSSFRGTGGFLAPGKAGPLSSEIRAVCPPLNGYLEYSVGGDVGRVRFVFCVFDVVKARCETDAEN